MTEENGFHARKYVFSKERNMRVGRDESRKGRNNKEQQKTQGIGGGCEAIVPGRGEVIGIKDCGKRNCLHSKTLLLSVSPGEQNSCAKLF